ncbi:MAG: hypothetical protein VX764_07065 [Planctomycetota bacterium]|nr:hypothetical protein [Planctomycetota bacterium]
MSLATFCIIVGIYEIMIGLPLVVKPQETANWFEGVIKNDLLLRLIGFLFLVISALVLVRGATISLDAAGIVRLLAWVCAIKCCLLCWWPQRVIAMKGWFWPRPQLMRVFGVIATAFGVWLLDASRSITG